LNCSLAPRRTVKSRRKNEETANHPWTVSYKSRSRSFECSQKTQRKRPDAIRRSLLSRNYNSGGICRQKGRSTLTDRQNSPTQHSSAVLQAARLLNTELQGETRQIQDRIVEKPKERWRAKRMHEKLALNLDKELDG